MSHTTIYAISKCGVPRYYEEFANSHGSAPMIWQALCKAWLGMSEREYYGRRLDELWPLADDISKPESERVVLQSTFDRAVVMRDDMLRLADAFDAFAEKYAKPGYVCSLPEQARVLREMHAQGFIGACWNQTSVNGDVFWFPWNSERDRPARPYNVLKRNEHWTVTFAPRDAATREGR